ncbi:MAG: hypothetical protein SO165_03990 [Lachnospiraceae bacterium]|nr:hypothetical protein [Lachnospiraceae bacterium]MDY4836909.1 hypothetical protein [Lachnospiraceae bacterium]
MSKFKGCVLKLLAAMALGVFAVFLSSDVVKADAYADALQYQQAQQALAAQQALEAQQKEANRIALEAQQALMAQYNQAIADQYAKALLVYQEAIAAQARAVQQSYMLASVQQLQNAQYTSMVQQTGLDYQSYLLDRYQKYQKQALAAFKGYEGIK